MTEPMPRPHDVPLDNRKLESGLRSYGDPTPNVPIAVVSDDLEALAGSHGLTLHATWDQLGPLKLALADVGGVRVSLERHEDSPEPGTTIALLASDVSPRTIEDVLDALDVDPASRRWVMPLEVAERRAAADSSRVGQMRLRKSIAGQLNAALAALELLVGVVAACITLAIAIAVGGSPTLAAPLAVAVAALVIALGGAASRR